MMLSDSIVKGIMKSNLKKFNHYTLMCRFKITKREKESNELTDKILKVLSQTFKKDDFLKSGNVNYVLVVLEEFFDWSEEVHKLVFPLMNMETLNYNQNSYIEKKKKLLLDLDDNFYHPHTLEIPEEIKNGEHK